MKPKMMVRLALLLLLTAFLTACDGGSDNETSIPPTAEATAEATQQAAAPAPDEACPALVRDALDIVEQVCSGTGRNQICYGNGQMSAVARADVQNFRLSQPGDLASVGDLLSLQLARLNTATDVWGIALMRVQANIPDTLPGQNITFLLFGDVQFDNVTSDDGVQSFYFRTGLGDSPCAEAPDSGVLVQTPDGVGEVALRVNDVGIELGSTAYLQAQAGDEMKVSVIEGGAQVSAQGTTRSVPAGYQSSVPLDANGAASAPPEEPERYNPSDLVRLPVGNLERRVTIANVLLSSDFTVDAEGWATRGDASEVSYFPADDTSDGYICADDQQTGESWYFAAPESWHSDQSASYGGTLEFTLKQSTIEVPYDAPDVILSGRETTLIYDAPNNPGEDWTAYSITLDENAGWMNQSTGEAASEEDIRAVLANVTDIQIRGEYADRGDTGCMDVVALTGQVQPTIYIPPREERPTPTPTVTPTTGPTSAPPPTNTPGPTRTPVPTTPPEAAPIGFEVTDTISTANEADSYTFTAVEGQRIYVDGQSGEILLNWELDTPDGTAVFNQFQWANLDLGVYTLPVSGEYTLTVSGEDAGDYGFQVWDVPAPNTSEIEIGQVVSDGDPGEGAGNIETPGVEDIYTFEAEPGQEIYIDGLEGDLVVNWLLEDEDGTVVLDTVTWTNVDLGNVVLERGGTYTLTLSAQPDYLGAYSFQIWDVPVPDTSEIEIGQVVSDGVPSGGAGNIESPGVEDIYTFEAEAGQEIYIDGLEGDLVVSWNLVDEDGTVTLDTVTWTNLDVGSFVLEQGGTYTLTLSAQPDYLGAYSFQIWDVPAPDTSEIEVGQIVSDGVPGEGAGNIESPGVEDIYTFEAEAGQEIYIDGLEGDLVVTWNLVDEDGTVVLDSVTWTNVDLGNVVLERGGTYTLTLSAQPDYLGAYSFQLWDVPQPQSFEIEIGQAVSDGVPGDGAGNIESPGVLDVYHFSGEAGQVIIIDGLEGDFIADVLLRNPPGDELLNTTHYISLDSEPITLDVDGDYELIIGAYEGVTGTYSFQISESP